MFERLKEWFRTLFKRKGGVSVKENYTEKLKQKDWELLNEILKEDDKLLLDVEKDRRYLMVTLIF